MSGHTEEASEPRVPQKKDGNHTERHLVTTPTASGLEGVGDGQSLPPPLLLGRACDKTVQLSPKEKKIQGPHGEGENLKLPLPLPNRVSI